jgi:exosortase/archaeosortase family protein
MISGKKEKHFIDSQNSLSSVSIPDLAIRYLAVLCLGLNSLVLIYSLFTPLTLYPVYFILNLFYNVSLSGTSILIGSTKIEIIKACIAGSAIYLLIILNLLTKMNLAKRLVSLVYSLACLLSLNIARIVILSVMLVNDFAFFDITHKLFWYVLSTIFVVAIWFSEVKLFSIKNIPVYSDMKGIVKLIKKK